MPSPSLSALHFLKSQNRLASTLHGVSPGCHGQGIAICSIWVVGAFDSKLRDPEFVSRSRWLLLATTSSRISVPGSFLTVNSQLAASYSCSLGFKPNLGYLLLSDFFFLQWEDL